MKGESEAHQPTSEFFIFSKNEFLIFMLKKKAFLNAALQFVSIAVN